MQTAKITKQIEGFRTMGVAGLITINLDASGNVESLGFQAETTAPAEKPANTRKSTKSQKKAAPEPAAPSAGSLAGLAVLQSYDFDDWADFKAQRREANRNAAAVERARKARKARGRLSKADAEIVAAPAKFQAIAAEARAAYNAHK